MKKLGIVFDIIAPDLFELFFFFSDFNYDSSKKNWQIKAGNKKANLEKIRKKYFKNGT